MDNKVREQLKKLKEPVYNSNNILSVEQRIHIAASFDSEKIKMIRELMEGEKPLRSYHFELIEYTIDNTEKRESIDITENQADKLLAFFGKSVCEKANLRMWVTVSINKPNKQ